MHAISMFTIVRDARPLLCRKLVLSVANTLLHSGRDGGSVVTVERRIPA